MHKTYFSLSKQIMSSAHLTIYMNEELILEFEKDTQQTDEQLQFIKNMNNEIAKGLIVPTNSHVLTILLRVCSMVLKIRAQQ